MRFSFVLTLCMLSATYFTYYTIQGDRGLLNWARLSNDIEKLEVRLEKSQSKIDSLNQRLALVNYDTTDRDMMDEQVRRMFVYIKAGEFRLLP